MSNKALQLMGLKVDELLKNALHKENGGRIKREEHRMFWQQATSKQQNAVIYINDMCTKMQAALLEPTKNPLPVRPDVLITTIQFITLFLEFKADHGSITRFLEGFKAHAMSFPTVKDVLRTLEYRRQDLTGLDQLSRHLVTQASILHTAEGFKKLNDPINFPTFVDADVTSVESALGFEFLRGQAKGKPAIVLNLLKTITPLLRTIPHQMKANPRLAETTLLAFLHMIRQLLATTPVNSPTDMSMHINIVQDFYLWPLPFGKMAQETLEALAAESGGPGAALRGVLDREYRVGPLAGMDDELGQSKRPIYYFVHGRTAEAITFSQMMELNKWKELKPEATAQAGMPAPVRCLLLMNLLQLHVDLTRDEELAFRRLSEAQAIELYDKAIKTIAECAANEDPAAALKERTEGLMKLKTVLMRIIASPSGQPITLPFPLPDGFIPPLPGLKHISVDTPANIYTLPSPADLEAKGIVDITPFPVTPALEFLQSVFKQHKPYASTNPVVRIVVAGGNEVLHNVACAFFHIQQNDRELLSGLEPKFYVVPFGRNHLASFLARYDSWYNRHIYGPFRSQLLVVPGIQVDENNHRDEATLTPPALLLRNLVESYVRESLREFVVTAWVVEGWMAETTGAPQREQRGASHVAIPCLMRVEMGRVPDARQFQLQRAKQINDDNKRYEAMTLDDVLKDKQFTTTFQPPEVKVTFQRVDVNGNPTSEHERKNDGLVVDSDASYETIVLANIPTMGDKAFAPDPSSKWLELYTQPSEKTRKNQRLVNNVLMKEAQQHVSHITVECQNKNQSMVARVDGQNFGPFVKVKVSPMRLSGFNGQRGLPIQTLFPVDM